MESSTVSARPRPWQCDVCGSTDRTKDHTHPRFRGRLSGELIANKSDHGPDARVTRSGRRYVSAVLEHPDLGKLELTLWNDGRYSLVTIQPGQRVTHATLAEGRLTTD